MARAKKEAALTPEERLQAALVPDWEWPYKLPGNWCWTYLTKAAECLDNFRKPINATERAGRNGNVPYYGATGQVGWIDDFLTDEDLVLLGEDGAPFLDLIKDKAYLITRKAWVNNHAHILRSLFGDTGNRYLLHYLNSFNYAGYVNGTTRLKLTRASMDTIPIPLPPLAEQQRIVDRIESLFAKLDEAKEKTQTVVDSFETRKSAILHKAFTGELTAKWREEHGVRMESWEKFKFNELGTLERGRSKHRPRNDPKLFGGKYPFIQTGDVARSGMYITEHTQTLSELGAEQSKLFPKGTLCITIAANIGDVSILTYDCCFPDSVVGFTPNERTLSEYIYYLMSTLQREIEANAPATAQKNINLRILNDLLLDIPSVAEQTQIVNQVEYLFFQEQHAKEAAEAVLDQIDLMKKSILARAFRGELGTNDPSEESAVKLLRQVIEQEDGDVVRPKAKAKRIAIPAEIKPLLSGANEEAIVKLLLKAAPQSVSTQTVMSVSKKKFELMDALRNLEKKQIVSKSDSGEYSLVR